jgi:hypothetical protein
MVYYIGKRSKCCTALENDVNGILCWKEHYLGKQSEWYTEKESGVNGVLYRKVE